MIYTWIYLILQVVSLKLLACLAKEEISITNIRIIETREEIYGVLVISFQTDEDRLKAC